VIPNVYFLSRDKDIHSTIEDQLSNIAYWPIEPKGTAEFVIADRFKAGKKISLVDQRVWFPVSWRRGSTTWLPQIPVTVRTETSTINKIRDVIIQGLK
jgi:hypothetical protein